MLQNLPNLKPKVHFERSLLVYHINFISLMLRGNFSKSVKIIKFGANLDFMNRLTILLWNISQIKFTW